MKLEERKFKEISHLILFPESESECTMLDNFFGKSTAVWSGSVVVAARLCTGDDWKPYLRIETNEAINVPGK